MRTPPSTARHSPLLSSSSGPPSAQRLQSRTPPAGRPGKSASPRPNPSVCQSHTHTTHTELCKFFSFAPFAPQSRRVNPDFDFVRLCHLGLVHRDLFTTPQRFCRHSHLTHSLCSSIGEVSIW